MKLTAEPISDGTVVHTLTTRIDAAAAIEFKDRMRELSAGGEGRVVLDLGPVQFIDSSGLGAVVAVMKALAPRPLELAALSPAVAAVFRLTRMDTVIPIHASVEAARDPVRQAS